MPFYEYAPDDESCEYCAVSFAVLQGLREKPVEVCPECKASCHRILSCFSVKGTYDKTAPKTLESMGFTQYRRAESGRYEKAFGKSGPDTLRSD